MIEIMQEFALSQTFGWTPKQIAEVEFEKKMAYLALLKGAGEADLGIK